MKLSKQLKSKLLAKEWIVYYRKVTPDQPLTRIAQRAIFKDAIDDFFRVKVLKCVGEDEQGMRVNRKQKPWLSDELMRLAEELNASVAVVRGIEKGAYILDVFIPDKALDEPTRFALSVPVYGMIIPGVDTDVHHTPGKSKLIEQ